MLICSLGADELWRTWKKHDKELYVITRIYRDNTDMFLFSLLEWNRNRRLATRELIARELGAEAAAGARGAPAVKLACRRRRRGREVRQGQLGGRGGIEENLTCFSYLNPQLCLIDSEV
jgi:hypothetical protein